MRADKQTVTRLLKTARGQLDGILAMVENDRYDLVYDEVRCGAAAHYKAQRQQKRAHRSQCEIQLFVAPPRPRRGGFCFSSPHPSAPQLIDKRKHFVHLLRLQGRVSAFKRLLHAAADMRF